MGLFFTLLKIVLVIAVLAFVGWNVWLKGKPIISIALFIKDRLTRDREVYPGYGFWLFCGLGGSGKTLSVVEYVSRMKQQYPKMKVYSNFYLEFADGQIADWQDIINLENFEWKEISKDKYDKLLRSVPQELMTQDGLYYQKHHYGIIFAFDEIHLTFASDKWKDCPDGMLEYISLQRKRHKHIIGTSQVFTRIDIKLREQTNFVVECSNLFGGRLIFNKYFNTCDYLSNGEKGDSGMRKRKRKKRYTFVAYDRIRDLYDTNQIVTELQKGKSKRQIKTDALKRELGLL